jgi:hypothetical protein
MPTLMMSMEYMLPNESTRKVARVGNYFTCHFFWRTRMSRLSELIADVENELEIGGEEATLVLAIAQHHKVSHQVALDMLRSNGGPDGLLPQGRGLYATSRSVEQ